HVGTVVAAPGVRTRVGDGVPECVVQLKHSTERVDQTIDLQLAGQPSAARLVENAVSEQLPSGPVVPPRDLLSGVRIATQLRTAIERSIPCDYECSACAVVGELVGEKLAEQRVGGRVDREVAGHIAHDHELAQAGVNVERGHKRDALSASP